MFLCTDKDADQDMFLHLLRDHCWDQEPAHYMDQQFLFCRQPSTGKHISYLESGLLFAATMLYRH
jgi:hypothetical protein